MSDLYLDLHNKTRVADFIAEFSEFSAPKDRDIAAAVVSASHKDPHFSHEKLANAARKLAIVAWPARYALERYFTKEGAAEEWTRVTLAVRPSTAHLLKRFRQGTTTETLDEVLNHDDADMAFKEGERLEISEIRHHLRHDFWKDKRKVVEGYVKEGKQLMDAYAERLGAMRELAGSLPSSMQDEIFSKIAHYEDRILYRGETVPLEILDQEVQYYREQKEISPME